MANTARIFGIDADFKWTHFGEPSGKGNAKRAFAGRMTDANAEAARIQMAYESRKNQCGIHYVARPGCECDMD